MGKTRTRKPIKGLTFEDVWAMFQESDRKWKERSEALDRQIKETSHQIKDTAKRIKETDQQMKDTAQRIKETDHQMKETDRQIKETNRRIGYLDNRFGELAEHLVAPNIKEKFKALGFTFEQVSQNHEITDASENLVAEIDILLENGDTAMAVEVKAKPLQKDVNDHIKRMEVLRRRADTRHDTRKYQGAIAGAIMTKSVRDYTHKAGFYVIEQTGDTVKITIPENFTPREW